MTIETLLLLLNQVGPSHNNGWKKPLVYFCTSKWTVIKNGLEFLFGKINLDFKNVGLGSLLTSLGIDINDST